MKAREITFQTQISELESHVNQYGNFSKNSVDNSHLAASLKEKEMELTMANHKVNDLSVKSIYLMSFFQLIN